MKKILILFLLIVTCNLAQESSNGNIRLIFNKETIDLPIISFALIKETRIVLSIRAEKQDLKTEQFISLEIGLKELSSEPNSETFDGTKINIRTKDKRTDSGKELAIWFDADSVASKYQSETIHYGIYSKGESVSWEITSVSLKIDITKVELKDGLMHITGEFNGKFVSAAAPPGQIAEVENGEFNIIF